MVRFDRLKSVCFVVLFCITVTLASPAQNFNTLQVFHGTNGGLPSWPLLQGTDGNFYGSTGFGGTGGQGTIFKISASGKLTTLQSIADAHMPLQATNGYFYGTTPYGGPMAAGTIFKMSTSGKLTTLYNFCSQPSCTDGAYPYGGLIQASDGNFYGTTAGGGANNYGTVFKITPKGKLTTLVSFDSVGMAGTSLVEGFDGDFYGTTSNGGANSDGTIFKVTMGGTLTTLHTFKGKDGKFPYDALIQGIDGNFYGTTYEGGANNPPNCGGLVVAQSSKSRLPGHSP